MGDRFIESALFSAYVGKHNKPKSDCGVFLSKCGNDVLSFRSNLALLDLLDCGEQFLPILCHLIATCQRGEKH
jgi:hypothetical protein